MVMVQRCLQMDPWCLGKCVAMKCLSSPERDIRRVPFSRLGGVLSVVATLLPAKCLKTLTGWALWFSFALYLLRPFKAVSDQSSLCILEGKKLQKLKDGNDQPASLHLYFRMLSARSLVQWKAFQGHMIHFGELGVERKEGRILGHEQPHTKFGWNQCALVMKTGKTMWASMTKQERRQVS